MKLNRIQDIDKLPSVLDIDEVNYYLIQLVDVIRKTNTAPNVGAEAINNLISYQGCNEEGLSLEVSHKILEYIEETYNPENKDSVDWNIGNLTNLTCIEAKEFLNKRLVDSKSEYEKREILEALSEIKIKT
jgi:hypothetical protein